MSGARDHGEVGCTVHGDSKSSSPFASYRLPRGRHGLPRTVVAENQRWRLIGAGAEVFAEQGYRRTTSKLIARRAAVSSSTFYEHFKGAPECLRAGYEAAAASVYGLLADVSQVHSAFPQRIAAATDSLVAFCQSERELTMLLGIELSASVAEVAAERDQLMMQIARLLWGDSGGAQRAAATTAEAHLVAAAVAFTCNRPPSGPQPERPRLPAELTDLLAVLPGRDRG